MVRSRRLTKHLHRLAIFLFVKLHGYIECIQKFFSGSRFVKQRIISNQAVSFQRIGVKGFNSILRQQSMEDFGISFSVKWWGVSLSVLLPAFVVTIFLIIGRAQVNVFSTGDIFLIIISSILIALKAGILEEILFRGFIMRLLESKWNKYIAVLVPSVLFSFAHLPSMETFTIGGVFLLIISGTLVGTMFSLASYAGNSIGNNILMHTVWNFAIVTDILHITTSEGAYGEPIFQLIIPSDSILLTGAGFGIEASLIAIIGYTLACLTLAFIYRRNHVGILEG